MSPLPTSGVLNPNWRIDVDLKQQPLPETIGRVLEILSSPDVRVLSQLLQIA